MSRRFDNLADDVNAIKWIVLCIFVLLFLVFSGEAESQEPAPATYEVPTPGYVEIIRRQAAEAYENSTDALADAASAKRWAKEAKAMVEGINEHLRTILPTTTLQERIDEQDATIRQQRELIDALYAKLPRPASIDYTHYQQLKGVAERGYVAYHAQANEYSRDNDVYPAIAKAAPGSTLMIDAEDWLYHGKPYYGEASDEVALKYLRNYAKLIRDVTPAAKSKRITLGVYEVPTTMWKSWNLIRNQPTHADYQKWLANQERVLKLAEQSDFLPALRDAGGFVYVQCYVPNEWLKHSAGPQWLGAVLDNMEAVLTKNSVPHRYLFRLSGGNEAFFRVMVEKTRGRCDVWEDSKEPERAGVFSKLLGEVK